ncbi:MAG: ATP synthase F0 subunit B [bacterium]|nr:ATP synthase F0 subunit B [bacterium]MDT8395146.1 ATP synthase F0 subunit B [bacterium]
MKILMRPAPGRFVLVLAAALVPVLAFAATGGEGNEGGGKAIYDLVMRIINFAVLVGALLYFARKPAVEAVRNSIESVRTMIRNAEAARKEAEVRMKEAEDRLAGVDKEIEELIANAREEAEVEKARILSDAEASVEKFKVEAAAAIEQELKKSQDILTREAAAAAVALAEEIISRKVTPEDHQRFVAEYLEKLEANQ